MADARFKNLLREARPVEQKLPAELAKLTAPAQRDPSPKLQHKGASVPVGTQNRGARPTGRMFRAGEVI